MCEKETAIGAPRPPRREELGDLHRVIAVCFGFQGEPQPQPQRRRARGGMALRESRIITVGGKPVSHIRITYNWLSIYGMRIRAASLGGVCTDPEHRGRGIATRLLEHCIEEVTRAGAKLLIISGDRGLYLRAQAVPGGPVWSAVVRRGSSPAASAALTARAAGPDDALTLARLHQREPVRYLRSADFFASMMRNGHRQPWVLESNGEVVAYLSMSRIWGIPRTAPVRALGEYAGSRAALVEGLDAVLRAAGLEEIRLGFPAHDAEMTYLFRSRGADLEPDTIEGHTFRLLDVPGLLRALRPHCAARLPARAVRGLSAQPSGKRICLRLGSEEAALGLSEMGALVFGGPDAPTIGGDLGSALARVFPVPLPLPGFNYV